MWICVTAQILEDSTQQQRSGHARLDFVIVERLAWHTLGFCVRPTTVFTVR